MPVLQVPSRPPRATQGALLSAAPPGPAAQIIKPRDYQRAALDAIHQARDRGITRQLVSFPTGAGKTIVAAHLVRETQLPTVMLVHRDELVRQSVEKLAQINPDLSIGVVKAERDELDREIIVASVQTLISPKRLARLVGALGSEVLVISDECHHDAAPSRRHVLETLDPTLLVGLTATPHRADNLGLGEIYQEIVAYVSMVELMARGQLARLRGLRVDTSTDLDGVATRSGEFVTGELAETVDTPARNRLVVDSWWEYAEDRTRTVAFCVNVDHAYHLRDAFRAQGVDAETVIGETSPAERADLFARFHRGELPVLTGCMVFTEGWDEPALDCILMARPTKSQGLYIQSVGRGARKHQGKSDCLVIDFVDNTSRHQLVTLPTLAGLDLPKDGRPPQETTEAAREVGELVDLLELAQAGQGSYERRVTEVNLFGDSPLVWSESAGYWAAKAGKSSWLVLLPRGEGYVPHLIEAPRGQTPQAQPLFDRPLEVDMAIGVAEGKVALTHLTDRAAEWRQRDEPPSDAQRAFARKLGIKVKAQTKAQISEQIDAALFRQTLDGLRRRGLIA
jgi:ATP-dependent helicase IRC3